MAVDEDARVGPDKIRSGEGVWRFGVPLRPIGFATVPKGYVRVEDRGSLELEVARHGVVVYDRPLALNEINGFELVALSDESGDLEAAKAVVSELAEYAAEYVKAVDEDAGMVKRGCMQALERCLGFRVRLMDAETFCEKVISGLKAACGPRGLEESA